VCAFDGCLPQFERRLKNNCSKKASVPHKYVEALNCNCSSHTNKQAHHWVDNMCKCNSLCSIRAVYAAAGQQHVGHPGRCNSMLAGAAWSKSKLSSKSAALRQVHRAAALQAINPAIQVSLQAQ